ncbi:hypothetical protein Tco_0359839 [Tanacetum coccineum]
MSVSKPDEMMSVSSKASVVSKFDMHVHVSTLSSKELEDVIETYGIPRDLRPRFSDPELTMDKLPDGVIGIYVEQLHQGGRNKAFSVLTGRNKAFSGAYISTGVDSFASRDTVYHHPDLAQILRDPKGWGNSFSLSTTFEEREITMDDYLCLPNWAGTVVSIGDPIPEEQRPPKRTVDPLPPNTAIPAKTPYQINIKKVDPKITHLSIGMRYDFLNRTPSSMTY